MSNILMLLKIELETIKNLDPNTPVADKLELIKQALIDADRLVQELERKAA